jgi:hypothetical protein
LLPFGLEPSVFSPAVKNVKVRIYKAIVLPLVLYGCETWSLTLWEEQGEQDAEENIWVKRDGVMGGWRNLHNEELRNLYSLPSIIRIIKSQGMRWAGNVARMGEKRNACRLFIVKPEGKRPLGRPRRRWIDNIKMDWTGLVWLRIGNTVMNLQVP